MNETIGRVVELYGTHKAKAAFLAPVIVAALVAAGNWIITGTFDATEIRTAAGGVLFGLASAVGAYRAPVGKARVVSDQRGLSLLEAIVVLLVVAVAVLLAVTFA